MVLKPNSSGLYLGLRPHSAYNTKNQQHQQINNLKKYFSSIFRLKILLLVIFLKVGQYLLPMRRDSVAHLKICQWGKKVSLVK